VVDIPKDYLALMNASQKAKINDKLTTIRGAGGKMYKEVAAELAEIKKIINSEDVKPNSGGQLDLHWTAFCISGDIGMGERTIRDLVKANDWLQRTEVSDDIIGSHSVRVLARISMLSTSDCEKWNKNKKSRAEAEKEMMDGTRFTEDTFNNFVGWRAGGAEKASLPSKKKLLEDVRNLDEELAKATFLRQEMERDFQMLRDERNGLEQQVLRLQSTIDSLNLNFQRIQQQLNQQQNPVNQYQALTQQPTNQPT